MNQLTTFLNKITAEKTPLNPRRNSKDSSYSRNSQERKTEEKVWGEKAPQTDTAAQIDTDELVLTERADPTP